MSYRTSELFEEFAADGHHVAAQRRRADTAAVGRALLGARAAHAHRQVPRHGAHQAVLGPLVLQTHLERISV